MVLPDFIIKNLNPQNWEEMWDKYMVVEGSKGLEYVWNTETTKSFIRALLQRVAKEGQGGLTLVRERDGL